MNEELKKLLEELSIALSDAIRDSGRIRDLLKRIEEKSTETNLMLAVVLGAKDKQSEIQKIIYGSDQLKEKKSTVRRVSAFDRRFLRALRIRLPD